MLLTLENKLLNYRSESDFATGAVFDGPRLATETLELQPVRISRVAPRRPSSRLRKALERVVAFTLIIPCLPLIAILWAAVKLTSPGPGLYRQRRTGWKGTEFEIYKLRTMTHNCEQHTGAVWSVPGDSRVTPLGKFLRKTHLDELPQLFNVLRGEMVLVGPRPERQEIIEKLLPQIPDYLDRIQVLPGVTGLAQIFNQPDRTIDDVRRKLQIDQEYIRCRSPWLDTRLVICTLLKCVGLNGPALRSVMFPILSRRLSQQGILVAE